MSNALKSLQILQALDAGASLRSSSELQKTNSNFQQSLALQDEINETLRQGLGGLGQLVIESNQQLDDLRRTVDSIAELEAQQAGIEEIIFNMTEFVDEVSVAKDENDPVVTYFAALSILEGLDRVNITTEVIRGIENKRVFKNASREIASLVDSLRKNQAVQDATSKLAEERQRAEEEEKRTRGQSHRLKHPPSSAKQNIFVRFVLGLVRWCLYILFWCGVSMAFSNREMSSSGAGLGLLATVVMVFVLKKALGTSKRFYLGLFILVIASMVIGIAFFPDSELGEDGGINPEDAIRDYGHYEHFLKRRIGGLNGWAFVHISARSTDATMGDFLATSISRKTKIPTTECN